LHTHCFLFVAVVDAVADADVDHLAITGTLEDEDVVDMSAAEIDVVVVMDADIEAEEIDVVDGTEVVIVVVHIE
jgi:hypothetical protein